MPVINLFLSVYTLKLGTSLTLRKESLCEEWLLGWDYPLNHKGTTEDGWATIPKFSLTMRTPRPIPLGESDEVARGDCLLLSDTLYLCVCFYLPKINDGFRGEVCSF